MLRVVPIKLHLKYIISINRLSYLDLFTYYLIKLRYTSCVIMISKINEFGDRSFLQILRL